MSNYKMDNKNLGESLLWAIGITYEPLISNLQDKFDDELIPNWK